jgi:hypothetical protein
MVSMLPVAQMMWMCHASGKEAEDRMVQQTEADCTFIALARTALPAAIRRARWAEAEAERHRKDAAGAAALRREFASAAEQYAQARNDGDLMALWRRLYDATLNTQAGLGILAEVAQLRAEVARLQALNATLAERVAAASAVLARAAEKRVAALEAVREACAKVAVDVFAKADTVLLRLASYATGKRDGAREIVAAIRALPITDALAEECQRLAGELGSEVSR